MEWIKTILEQYKKEDGTFDVEGANKAIDKAFPENAVPKDQYNNVSSQLKTANKALTDLKEQTKDNPEIQKQLEDAQQARESAEAELKQLKIDTSVKDALQSAGAKDVDYAMFKLGKLEMDAKGNIKDLDNRVKELKESMPDYFQTAKEPETKNETDEGAGNGYRTIDNGLQDGKEPTGTDVFQAIVDKY
ncbi:phage scaffolding protein [Enterococcus nangangensis]|uniref:phage scaffolding protein n=1 Tax=Enterococcus nangangensis TaxID=2559926 RepID=UPI0010F61D75|nr:phage scaffolding protein [Enterococcus nangangensis]